MKKVIWLLPFVLLACSHQEKNASSVAPAKTEGKTCTAEMSGKGAHQCHDEASAKASVGSEITKAAETGQGKKLTCKSGNDVRTLTINVKDEGCELVYNKFGKDKIAATGANGLANCEKVLGKYQGTLEKAGFTCE